MGDQLDSDSDLWEGITSSELCTAMKETSLEDKRVKKLAFSVEKFIGKTFYEKYKGAEFLENKRNIARILSQRNEVLTVLDTMKPGEKLRIEGMFLKPGIPLFIKKSGCIDESDVGSEDITFRRLSGLSAAFVWNNIKDFDGLYATEPEALGLAWTDTLWECQLYLSAVSGAEYFQEFSYIPFICALRKYNMKMISENMLVHIASIPHSVTGEPMAVWYRRKFSETHNYNKKLFYAAYYSDVKKNILKAAPNAVRVFLQNLDNY